MNPYAVKYGLGRAWGYSVLSLGAWPFYWLYVNRRLLDGETARGRDDALLHTLGLLVPVLNAFILYSIALGRVNEFWDARTLGLATEAPTTTAEKAVIAVGASMWVLTALSVALLVVLLIVGGESSS